MDRGNYQLLKTAMRLQVIWGHGYSVTWSLCSYANGDSFITAAMGSLQEINLTGGSW